MTNKLLILFSILAFVEIRAQWIQQNANTNTNLIDVQMLDSTTAVVAARGGEILRTTNSGQTWFNETAHLSYINQWNSISFFDKENGAVVGENGSIMVTVNKGKGWIWRTIPKNLKCLSVILTGPGNIYVGSDSGYVHHSLDTGKTWISQKISDWPIRSLFPWRGAYVLGLPIYALTPHSILAKTIFPVSNWKEKILTQFQGLGSGAYEGEFCNGGGAGFIVGIQGDLHATPIILRKEISDTTWQYLPTGVFGSGWYTSVSAPSEKVIYIGGSNGKIIKSTNGGDDWQSINSPVSKNINAIYFFDEKRGFAVGDDGLILYTSNGVITDIKDEEKIPDQYSLSQNYPNPFNPKTSINYQIPAAGNVSLKVYDVLGNEIVTLVNEYKISGTYNIDFDVSNRKLASGFYYYKLIAGNWFKTKKMVLLK